MAKRSFLILFLVLPTLCYGINWVDQASDGDEDISSFHNAANWSPAQTPDGQQCWIATPDLGSPVSYVNETIEYLVLGNDRDLESCQLYVNGG